MVAFLLASRAAVEPIIRVDRTIWRRRFRDHNQHCRFREPRQYHHAGRTRRWIADPNGPQHFAGTRFEGTRVVKSHLFPGYSLGCLFAA
jgi:hypothetical protein